MKAEIRGQSLRRVYMCFLVYIYGCHKVHWVRSRKNRCTNGWRIFWTSVCCPFVHKRLTNILDDCLLSVCAQTVDRYISTKGKRKFNENKENHTLGECKQFSQEKQSIHLTANGQQMVDRFSSAQTVARADLYPFAVRTLVNRLLYACCPFAVRIFLLCTQ